MSKDERLVFVLMPFREEFDDVYAVIKDACNDRVVGGNVHCLRADEIEKPGRITDQIIDAIKKADVIIADLTGSNPNVMYELGFAHALGKHTVIINQSVKESPFDVAGMRQILYDRNRLIKDCRPRLVASLSEIFGMYQAKEEVETEVVDESGKQKGAENLSPLVIGDRLTAKLQAFHLQMQLANTAGKIEDVQRIATDALNILNRISTVQAPDQTDLRNFVGVIGNCAVELEKAELYREAEDFYKRALGLMSTHGGVHLQYADFLVDRGRIDEAQSELKRARELSPNDRRIPQLETKIALAAGKTDEKIETMLREAFDRDRSDSHAAAAYLMFLDRSGAPTQEFERVCREWEKALPENEKHVAIRVLADYFASHDESQRAIELYERILPNFAGNERAHILHNMATLYAIQNLRDNAEKAWTEAYKLSPTQPAIQAAFSQRLASWGKLDLAVKVASGLPID